MVQSLQEVMEELVSVLRPDCEKYHFALSSPKYHGTQACLIVNFSNDESGGYLRIDVDDLAITVRVGSRTFGCLVNDMGARPTVIDTIKIELSEEAQKVS